jgi:hypothetical protein
MFRSKDGTMVEQFTVLAIGAMHDGSGGAADAA